MTPQPRDDLYTRRLTPGFLFREAARTLRDRFVRVLSLGIAIALAAALIDQGIEQLIEREDEIVRRGLGLALLLIAMLATGATSFGSTFLSGVLDRTVGAHQHGHPDESIATSLRTLPFVRLITADLLVSLLRIIGFALLGIPGLIAMTLTAVVGPIVILEQRSAWSAIKRSAQLVWPRFWLVAVAVTLPLLAEGVLDEIVSSIEAIEHSFVNHTIVNLAVEVPLAIYVSLVEVTLAYHLVERDRPGSISARHHAAA